MRIALVTSPPSIDSGVAVHVRLLCDQLLTRGHKVYLVCKKTSFAETIASQPITTCWIRGDHRNKSLLGAVSDIIQMRSFFRDHRIEIIHCHHRWLAILSLVAVQGLHIGRVWSDHSELVRKRWLTKLMGDQVVSVSACNRERLINLFGLDPRRIQVVLNGVPAMPSLPPAEIERIKDRLGLSKAAPIIITVSRVVEGKGVDHLIESIAYLSKEFPSIVALIAGSGPLIEEYDFLSKKLNVQNHVRFLGPVNYIPELLNVADIFVLASRSEGIPLSIAEAMSLGKPIVATRVGGVPEMLENSVEGLLVEAGDVRGLSAAISRVTSDPALSKSLGDNARLKYRRSFSVSQMMDQIEGIYLGLNRMYRLAAPEV